MAAPPRNAQHEALELTSVLADVVARRHRLARRPDFKKAMTSIASSLLKSKDVDGQVEAELKIAKANLEEL